MLDRPRRTQLTWALTCLALLAAVTALVVVDPGWLVHLDGQARPAAEWAADEHWLRTPLEVVERALGTVAMSGYTVLLVLLLLLRRHRRAAILSAGVMVAASLLDSALKAATDRHRPPWQEQGHFLVSRSFPSGHASASAALGGLAVLLAVMLIRRASIRRLVYAGAVLLVLVACTDRVLLGRHYPSDVVGGTLLGVTVVLVGLTLYNPLPRSHALGAAPLPQAFPRRGRLAVVLNPIKVESVEGFQSIVRQLALESGWQEPAWYYTTVEDPGTGQAEQAAVEGAELVIVCGGDGTVREVCAELAGTGIPVGIVPAGTGNLLARNLGIPLYLRAAIDVALTGQDRAIDLVEVSGDAMADTHFLVMAGMGLDAAMIEGVNEQIKAKVGWFAYVVSGAKALMSPVVRIEISVDGGEYTTHRARTVVVGNVGYLQAGMPLLPDAAIDDGVLDVVLLHPKRFLSWVPLAFRVLAKRPRTDETITRMRGRTVSVRAASATPRQLDGDPLGAGCELHMICRHGRVLVRVPR